MTFNDDNKVWSYEYNDWIVVKGGGKGKGKSKGKGKGNTKGKGKGKGGGAKGQSKGKGKSKGKMGNSEFGTMPEAEHKPHQDPNTPWFQCMHQAEGHPCRGWCFKGDSPPEECKFCHKGWDHTRQFYWDGSMVGPKNKPVIEQQSEEVTLTQEITNNVLKTLTEDGGLDKDSVTAMLIKSGIKMPKPKVVTIEKTAVQLIKAEADLKKIDDLFAQQKTRYDRLKVLLKKSHDILHEHATNRCFAIARVSEFKEAQMCELKGDGVQLPYASEDSSGAVKQQFHDELLNMKKTLDTMDTPIPPQVLLHLQKLDALASIAKTPAESLDAEIEKELSEDETNSKDAIYGAADEGDEDFEDLFDNSGPPDDFGMEENEDDKEEHAAKKTKHANNTPTPEQYADQYLTDSGVEAWPPVDLSLNMTKAKAKAAARARSRSPHTGAASSTAAGN